MQMSPFAYLAVVHRPFVSEPPEKATRDLPALGLVDCVPIGRKQVQHRDSAVIRALRLVLAFGAPMAGKTLRYRGRTHRHEAVIFPATCHWRNLATAAFCRGSVAFSTTVRVADGATATPPAAVVALLAAYLSV